MTQALTMQPPTAEELELKQHVTKALASQGVLGKIKAQLRAAVFHVMHEREQDDELRATSTKLQEFQQHDGALALAIVMDFLAFFQLEHSLAVLRAEANAENDSTRSESQLQLDKLCDRLGLSQQHHKDGNDRSKPELRLPLLIQILQQQQPPEVSETSKDPTSRDGRLGDADAKQQQQKQNQFTSNSDYEYQSRHKADAFGGKGVASNEKLYTERLPTLAPISTASSSTKYADERGNRSESDDGDDEADAYKNVTKGGNTNDKLDVNLVKPDADGDEDDDEIASGSELSESIAEEQSASLNYSQDYESASRNESADFNDESAKRGAAAIGSGGAIRFEVNTRAAAIREKEEEEEHGDSGGDEEDDTPPVGTDGAGIKESEKDDGSIELAAPPPVPTTLSSSLPPIAVATTNSANRTSSRRGTLQDDDEFDEELEAARLSSLDAKLKAMEAEDETGTLQQLKASLQMELQQDDKALKKKSSGAGGKSADGDDDADEEEHDGYGSDFEEEEVISEVSDDEVGSVSDLLSDYDESQSQVLSTLKQQEPRSQSAETAHEDRAVEDENALNSYDYIETVERDW